MPYRIRTADGRTMICTADATVAASHAEAMEKAGTPFTVTDMSGNEYSAAGLHELIREKLASPVIKGQKTPSSR